MELKSKLKFNKRYFDFTLLFIVIFIIAFGLLMVYSTSSYIAELEGDGTGYLRKQLISVVVGSVAMAITTVFPYKVYQKKKFKWFAFAVAFVSILLILTPLGHSAKGAKRWLYFGSLSIQPAEICKFCMIIFVAAFLTQMGKKTRASYKGFWFPMFFVGFICALVLFITDNLSSALIIGFIGLFMILLGEKKNIWPYIILMLTVVVAGLVVLFLVKGWLPASMSFRLERVLAWLNPEAYADKKGHQVLQSLYGIGSGGIWGKGLGKSMQKLGFLPEPQNDMIFSIICEELGIVGGFSVITMYVLLLWRIRDVTVYTKDYFGNLLVTGVFCHIALQVVLNIAVVTNLIPNTGISLPFISYGGSSIIFTMGEIGLVLNVGMHAKFAEEEINEETTPEAD